MSKERDGAEEMFAMRRREEPFLPDDDVDPPYVPPPFQPARYAFNFSRVVIRTTRSANEDTNWICFAENVGPEINPSFLFNSMGDVNDGSYDFYMQLPSVFIDRPDQIVKINYLIYNDGFRSRDEMDYSLRQSSIELFAMGNRNPDVWPNVVGPEPEETYFTLEGYTDEDGNFVAGANFSFPNIFGEGCDGPVAIDQFVLTGQQLWNRTQAGVPRDGLMRALPWTSWYDGKESTAGCGDNSEYEVEWNLSRFVIPISVVI